MNVTNQKKWRNNTIKYLRLNRPESIKKNWSVFLFENLKLKIYLYKINLNIQYNSSIITAENMKFQQGRDTVSDQV